MNEAHHSHHNEESPAGVLPPPPSAVKLLYQQVESTKTATGWLVAGTTAVTAVAVSAGFAVASVRFGAKDVFWNAMEGAASGAVWGLRGSAGVVTGWLVVGGVADTINRTASPLADNLFSFAARLLLLGRKILPESSAKRGLQATHDYIKENGIIPDLPPVIVSSLGAAAFAYGFLVNGLPLESEVKDISSYLYNQASKGITQLKGIVYKEGRNETGPGFTTSFKLRGGSTVVLNNALPEALRPAGTRGKTPVAPLKT